jgi:type VI secretion system protein ImpK
MPVSLSDDLPGQRPGGADQPSESLALLYQGLLTGIVRVQALRQHVTDGESFRRRTKATLHEIERVAVATGYEGRDVRDTHFAVVAFLDSVVLHSRDPVRAEWETKTLIHELYGQADAGVVFFDKLDQFRSRRDTEQLADILEVYLLCLLLGFEGRYSGRRGELDGTIESLRMRIEYIRGGSGQLSPNGALPSGAAPVALARPRSDRMQLVAVGVVVFAILFFLILRFNLVSLSDDLTSTLF